MLMAYCSKCGEKLPKDASFCPKCGAKTLTGTAANATPQSDELNEAFAKMSKELEKAFTLAAKEMHAAFQTARENIQKSFYTEPVVCPSCGEKNSGIAVFCFKCGKKLDAK
jgi:ribosomal protein L40E